MALGKQEVLKLKYSQKEHVTTRIVQNIGKIKIHLKQKHWLTMESLLVNKPDFKKKLQ